MGTKDALQRDYTKDQMHIGHDNPKITFYSIPFEHTISKWSESLKVF